MNTVAFPGLGLEFHLNRVAVTLFGFEIYWYGLLIASGFLLAVILCSRWAPRFGVTSEQILDLLLFAVPAAIVGLRTYYVVFYLDLYRLPGGGLDWGAIFSIRDGGLAIYGGIIACVITLVIFCSVRTIDFFAFADLGVLGLLIGQIIGRWGNFMNVEAYGGLTTLPWRMCSESIAGELYYLGYANLEEYQAILDGILGVHPTFFYESAWNLAGLVLLCLMGRYARKFDGQLFFSYLMWYGVGRFWIEGMRTDSLYFFGLELFGVPIRVSQVVALLTAVVSGILLLWQLRRPHQAQALYVNRLEARKAQAQQNKTDSEEM